MTSPLEGFIRDERLVGVVGELADVSQNKDVATFTNDDPRAAQSDTITITGATNDKIYTVTIDGVAISFTADGSATTTEIALGLADAIKANGLVNGRFASVTPAVAVITLVARIGGNGYTLTEADSEITLAVVTANATAAAVPFGRLILHGGASSGSNKLAILADGASLTAQVQALALTFDDTVLAKVGVRVYDPATGDTNTYEVEHAQTASADASVIALAALLQTALPANTVDVTHPDADTLTFTAEIAGVVFELEFGFGTGADTAVWAHTTPTPGSDINELAAGVALRDLSQSTDPAGVTEIAPGEAISGLRKGRVFVATEADVTATDRVFVRLVADGLLVDLGGFAPAAGAGLVPWTGASWSRQAETGLGILQVNL